MRYLLLVFVGTVLIVQGTSAAGQSTTPALQGAWQTVKIEIDFPAVTTNPLRKAA